MSSIVLTEEDIMRGKSDAGGWNAKQLKILGISWPPPPKQAWIAKCIGRRISSWKYQKFLELRGMTKARLRAEAEAQQQLKQQGYLPLPPPEPIASDDPVIPPEVTEFKRWASGAYQRGEQNILQLIALYDEKFGNPFSESI